MPPLPIDRMTKKACVTACASFKYFGAWGQMLLLRHAAREDGAGVELRHALRRGAQLGGLRAVLLPGRLGEKILMKGGPPVVLGVGRLLLV